MLWWELLFDGLKNLVAQQYASKDTDGLIFANI